MTDEVTSDREADLPSGRLFADRHPPGNVIGPYKLISLLGEGGFGSVYLAEQSSPVQRRVALKLTRLGMDSQSVTARFEAERQALALMDHPSVAKVFDGGVTAHGRPFFVMELVRGDPITRFCELERMSVEDRVRLMIQVCGAVQHAHMKGVLHRDLKPSNILVMRVDGNPLPKVIDFGVAKALNQRLSESTVYTEIGQMIGTPEYMSPEQARGSADVDTRADIYALGAILYELLTGATPVDLKVSRSEGYSRVEQTIADVNPIAPSQRMGQLAKSGSMTPSKSTDVQMAIKHVRGELDWITLKCLEKERSRRYDSAAAMADDLERYLNDDPVLAGPPSAAYKAAKFVRRHRVAVTASVLVALSLIGGVVGAGYGLAKAVREAAAAKLARDESEAVTDFLTNMIQSVQPDESGKDVTVREVLDQSSSELAKQFGDRPIVEARLRHALGLSYWSLGQLDDAEEHLPAALEIRRKTLGPDHLGTLQATVNLASLRLDQGKLVEAEELLLTAVEGLSKTVGEDDALTLGALSNLSVTYTRLNATDKALVMARRVYDGQRRAQGPDHPHTLGAQVNLADLLAEMGKLDEAEPMMREAVASWERAHGGDKSGTLQALHSLAMLELALGRLDDADATMRRAVEGRWHAFGESHKDTLGALANLGIILSSKGNIAEAEAAFFQSWSGLRAELGDGHLTTLRVMNHLAGAIEQQGWPERSRGTVQGIIDSSRIAASLKEIPASDLNNIAWLLLHVEPTEIRDADAALKAVSRACDQERSQGGKDLWMYLDTLAAAQHQSGASASALASQREALRLLPDSAQQYRGEMEQRAAEYESASADAQ